MNILSRKPESKRLAIQTIPDAPFYYLPLLQHIGKAAEPVVQVGDQVTKYQLIGKAAEGLSAAVHAPVSGIVRSIGDYPLADGTRVPTICIENDYKETEEKHPATAVDELTSSELVDIVRAAGIVGEGGAQFPTALKYTLDGYKISTFIVNGTECEPYLTADYALMAERTKELFEGIRLINKILGAEEIVLTIEEQNRELVSILEPFTGQNPKVRLHLLPNEYPQGGELQVIKSVTGRELPRNKRPRDIGVIVNNVGTVYAVREAVVNRTPLISRILTVSGEASVPCGNYEVKIGTPFSHLLWVLQLSSAGKEVILGGPMMGKAVEEPDAPVIKGSSGVIFFQKREVKRNNCISCGYCVDVCPMHLMPMKFDEIYRSGKFFKLEMYQISNCIECAACEYICPSDVPLIESIKEGKNKLKQLAHAIQ